MYTVGFEKDGRFYPQTNGLLRNYINECYEIPDDYCYFPLFGFARKEHALGLLLQWVLECHLGNFSGNGYRDSDLEESVNTCHDVLKRLNDIVKDGFFTDYLNRRWCVRKCEWPDEHPFVMIAENNQLDCFDEIEDEDNEKDYELP